MGIRCHLRYRKLLRTCVLRAYDDIYGTKDRCAHCSTGIRCHLRYRKPLRARVLRAYDDITCPNFTASRNSVQKKKVTKVKEYTVQNHIIRTRTTQRSRRAKAARLSRILNGGVRLPHATQIFPSRPERGQILVLKPQHISK